MTLSPLLLGALPAKPTVSQTILFQANGLLIVFIVLGSLWLLVELIGAVFKRRDARLLARKAAAAGAMAPVSKVPTTGAVTPEIVAAISAAVHTVLAGKRHRIVSVSPGSLHGHAASHGSVWATEGRRDIFTSHRMR